MATSKPYATDAVWLDLARGRFTITVDILRSAGWTELSKSEELVAEIIGHGHIRLHRHSAIQSTVETLKQEAANEASNKADLRDRLQVLVDRYHDTKFSRSDNRVLLRPEVVMALAGDGEAATGRVRLFMQAGDAEVDVMTNAVRISRLQRYAD
jgi:hypothetical protein